MNAKYYFPRYISLCILLLSVIWSSNSDAQNISFKKLGLSEGLSENAGLAIHQDHLNRMWFATRNGLNCWDGIRMIEFYPRRGDTTSLMEHKVSELVQVDKFLWVKSSKGVSRLDLNLMSFNRYYIDRIKSICQFNETLLAASEEGVWIYNNTKDIFERPSIDLKNDEDISAIMQDNYGRLWLTSDERKKLILIENNQRTDIDIHCEGNLMVYDLLMDSQSRLWIATRYNGLFIYDVNKKKFENVNETSRPFYLQSLTARDIIEDREGRIWVGTFKGLTVFDLNKQTTSFIEANESNPHSLSHNSIHSLYLSNDDNIWIGTYFGGINYGKVSNQVFNIYHQSASGERPSYPVIGSLVEDDDKNIWIATEGGGLDYFDRENNTFTNIPFTNDENGLSQTNVKSLLLIDNDRLLIGTYQGGLNCLDINTGKVKHYTDFSIKKHPKHVNSIVNFKGKYLLATEYGAMVFDLNNESFIPLLSRDRYPFSHTVSTDLFVDSKGVVWMGFEYEGLLAYNPITDEVKHFSFNEFDEQSIGYNGINYIMEDHQFRLWFGTNGGGLCKYNRSTNNFTTFNHEKNNLPSDFVYGLVESRFGNLWISTSKGLSRFDVENKQFFNYTYESGFPLHELNFKALLLTHNGELFVGGIDGLISFKEQDILLINEEHRINLSDLWVNNKKVMANDETGIISKDISVAEGFKLKPKHSVFTINYSSCDYNRTIRNKYQYMLEGFDEDWVDAEYNVSATYTNMGAGDYVFKVRGTDVAYNPITSEKTLNIHIDPPLTQTWWAYALYIFLFMTLVVIFNYFYLSKVRLSYQLNTERSEKENIKSLNQYKLKFFTNVSHEFMTPLTIILSALDNIFTNYKVPSKLKEQLDLAYRNARRLKNLNSELLDFRKIEQGHMNFKIQENDLVPYLNDIYSAFKMIAEQKGVDYQFVKSTDHVNLFYDTTQMDKVFYNLLSNAFKHVPEENGIVSIVLESDFDHVLIKVIDNGNGIPENDVDKVFNRFFRLDSDYTSSEYKGSGIGLALTQSIVQSHNGEIICESREGEGTTFKVKLLKGNKHINNELLANEKIDNQFSISKDLIDGVVGVKESSIEFTGNPENLDAPLLLVVDDNPEIRIVIKNLFIGNYRIELANDGAEGFEKALELQPDIIISDIKMPKMSGLEMCEKLKRNMNTSHIPIVLLTALATVEDRTQGFIHGADAYCTKPFNAEMLHAIVSNLFKNRSLMQKRFSMNLNTETKLVTQNIVDRSFLEKAQSIIENNLLNSEFSVDEFAVEMQLGRTIFYNKVKTITGQTPNEFIQTIRLKKAASMLLESPEKNVSEVAYDTGFNSPRYFSMCFKNHFGVSPSKYIRANNLREHNEQN